MSPLPFPTDNLYKFIALTGAALILFSFAYPLARLDEIELAVQQNNSQRAVLEIEAKSLEDDTAELGMDVKTLLTAAAEKAVPTSTLNDKADQATAQLAKLAERQLALKIKRTEIQGSAERSAVLLRQMERTWSYLRIGGFIGLAMANVGFILWYRRVQRPADEEAKRRARSDA